MTARRSPTSVRLPLFQRHLRSATRSLVGWSAGVVATTLFICAVYPSFRDNVRINDLLKNYPSTLKSLFGIEGALDFASGRGYLQTELFGTLLPLLLIVFAIGFANKSTAGEEESGTLSLTMSLPVRRVDVVASTSVLQVVVTLGLGAVAFISLVAWNAVFSIGVDIRDLLIGCFVTTLLALHIGFVALAVGWTRGHKGAVIGVASSYAVFAFLWNGLAPIVKPLRGSQKLSPWYWTLGHEPMRNGVSIGRVAVTLGLTLLVAVAGAIAFQRRDLA